MSFNEDVIRAMHFLGGFEGGITPNALVLDVCKGLYLKGHEKF